jgi:hypothetical protein
VFYPEGQLSTGECYNKGGTAGEKQAATAKSERREAKSNSDGNGNGNSNSNSEKQVPHHHPRKARGWVRDDRLVGWQE